MSRGGLGRGGTRLPGVSAPRRRRARPSPELVERMLAIGDDRDPERAWCDECCRLVEVVAPPGVPFRRLDLHVIAGRLCRGSRKGIE